MSDASVLGAAIGELSSGDLRTLLARTERPTAGRASELRPRLREAVREGELAAEEVLRRLEGDALEALIAFHDLSPVASGKHQDLVQRVAQAIKVELAAPPPRTRGRKRRPAEPGADELARLRDELDEVLDERARLLATNARLKRELEQMGDELREEPGLAAAPRDLQELLRSLGIRDADAFRKLYRPAAKVLHPDKNADGEAAFRLLTKIRDLLEKGR